MNSNVEQLPQKTELAAGAPVQAIVPRSMEDAYRIATAVVAAGMAPPDMNTQEKCLVAVMQGLEVGMTPMQSIQRIAVINGRPTIWGDAAIGLVRGSGLCEYVHERIEGEGDDMAAHCEAKRRGEDEPIVGSFSVADAQKAGLWSKKGPWSQYPKRMLQMRARGFALRDAFADVLGGMYIREELEADERDMRDITPPSPPPDEDTMPPAPPAEQEPAAPAPPESEVADAEIVDAGEIPACLDRREKKDDGQTEAPQVDEVDPETGEVLGEADPIDPDKYLDDLDAQMSGAGDQSTLDEIWLQHEDKEEDLFPPDRAEARKLYDKHKKRIAGS